ncbi:MAG: hypothetical protein Q7S46_00800 [Gallionella sp.]|nr:hypothetical protein [Gallionella sp.]
MSDTKQFQVGLIKSVSYDYAAQITRGIIETVNDDDNDLELPFIISDTRGNLEKGKMVKFLKETDAIVPRAEGVVKL